ncbi:MAG TPA: hypothetical protein VHB79_06655 [Polyangiaceae bacterium]|nr:hypothetical protein [Polyangiaceae bacterium]
MTVERPRAKLVLVEPGVEPGDALSRPSEQNHILVLGEGEAPSQFCDRVRRRTDALRRQERVLDNVTYLVSCSSSADWSMRRRLLAQLCDEMAQDGSVAVLAPRSASVDVLGCIGELQASVAQQRELRAIFIDAEPSEAISA